MTTYPLTIPSHEFKSISMRLKRVIAVSESPFSFAQQTYEHQGARWEAEVSLPPMKRADAAAWQAFFVQLKGRRGTFVMGDPTAATALGTATAATVNGAVAALATTMAVDGMGAGATLLKGTYIQVGSGSTSRLHMLVENTTANGSGQGTLTFEPPTRSTISDNAAVTLSSPKGVWRMASNDYGWDISDALIYGFTFACVEAL